MSNLDRRPSAQELGGLELSRQLAGTLQVVQVLHGGHEEIGFVVGRRIRLVRDRWWVGEAVPEQQPGPVALAQRRPGESGDHLVQ